MFKRPSDYRESDPIFAADDRARAFGPGAFNLTTGTLFTAAGDSFVPEPSIAGYEALYLDGDKIFDSSYYQKGHQQKHLSELALRFLHGSEKTGPAAYFTSEGGSGAMIHILNLLKDAKTPFIKRQKITDAARMPVVMTTPKWPNHPLILHGHGFDNIHEVPHLTDDRTRFNIEGLLTALRETKRAILLLQTAPHNPTGKNASEEDWLRIADEADKRGHVILLDSSFPGFSQEVTEDMKPSRILSDKGIEHFNAVSLSKIFGIPAWRTGLALHVHGNEVKPDGKIMEQDIHAIRSMAEWQMRNADSLGTYVITNALERQEHQMHLELRAIRESLQRKAELLIQGLPEWSTELEGTGQFRYIPKMSKVAVTALEKAGVFLAPVEAWRNTLGLRLNLGRLAEARIDEFIRLIRTQFPDCIERKKRPA